MEEKNPIQVADRLFNVMELLAMNGPMGLLEISKELELNKSTVHRVLNSLIYMGYVKQNEETSKYSLTYKICRLSTSLIHHTDLVEVARPFLKELSFKTGETVHLVIRDGNNAIYIDKVENDANTVRLISTIGKSIPLYCSGVGKAMMADMDEERMRTIWKYSDIVKYTDKTITDIDSMLRELKDIRKKGYAIDNEEMEVGVKCVAVSIPDFVGRARYGLSISVPVIRMNKERIRELAGLLKETKEQIIEAWS